MISTPSAFRQGIVLASFVLLIIGFVAWRSGAFGPKEKVEHVIEKTDSVIKVDSTKFMVMPSSKSGEMVPVESVEQQSAPKAETPASKNVKEEKSVGILPSSKSGVMVGEKDILYLKDTAKRVPNLNNAAPKK